MTSCSYSIDCNNPSREAERLGSMGNRNERTTPNAPARGSSFLKVRFAFSSRSISREMAALFFALRLNVRCFLVLRLWW